MKPSTRRRLRDPYFVLICLIVLGILIAPPKPSALLMVLGAATLWVDWKTRPDRDPRNGPPS